MLVMFYVHIDCQECFMNILIVIHVLCTHLLSVVLCTHLLSVMFYEHIYVRHNGCQLCFMCNAYLFSVMLYVHIYY